MRVAFTLLGGLVGGDGVSHRRGSLRPLNGFDEERLHALPPSTPRAVMVTELLARAVKTVGEVRMTREVARALSSGDRDYLLLQLCRATYGETLALVLVCPRCDAKMDLDLRIDQIPVEERAPATSHRVVADDIEIEFRLPRGGDEEALAGLSAEAAREQLLDACVIGARPAWSAARREALIAAIEREAPRVESELEVNCPECGGAFDSELDIAQLVLGEVLSGRNAFERELHTLAFHYHWSLHELMSLTRPRRRRFLGLLSGELSARAG